MIFFTPLLLISKLSGSHEISLSYEIDARPDTLLIDF